MIPSSSIKPETSTKNVTHKANRQVDSQSSPDDSAPSRERSTPWSPFVNDGSTTPEEHDIGADAQAELRSLCQSYDHLSLSEQCITGSVLRSEVLSSRSNDWIVACARELGAPDTTNSKPASTPKRRKASKKTRYSLQVLESGSSTPNAANCLPLKLESRPYTTSLGTPVHLRAPEHLGLSPISSKEPSEISDAGHQLSLRHRQRTLSTSAKIASPSGQNVPMNALSIYSSQHEFQRIIIASFQRTQTSYGQSQEFLPEGCLYELVNPLSVASELTHSLGHMYTRTSIDAFAEKICGDAEILRTGRKKTKTYRKIFVLLVLVGATASTPCFLDKEICDLDLPLQLPSPETYEPNRRDRNLDVFRYLDDLNWSPVVIRTFLDYQWMLLAPFFANGKHGDVMHYSLRGKHILPFLLTSEAEKKAEKAGGYAKVSMVRIHQDHHDFHDQEQCNRGFAIKHQLYASDRDVFEKEIMVLKKFSGKGRSHGHIISLLATFEQFDKLNLIFHRAEGDLFTYWSQIESAPQFTWENIKWVAKQCEGLTEALLKVHRHLTFTKRPEKPTVATPDVYPSPAVSEHPDQSFPVPGKKVKASGRNAHFPKETMTRASSHSTTDDVPLANDDKGSPLKLYGRHGDINPGNILWYSEQGDVEGALSGTLKIADFGQAEFNSLKSRTAPRNIAITLTYRAPECDTPLRHEMPIIRPRYDIWCMGCVFLEFVTWILGGERLLMELNVARMTRERSGNGRMSDTFFQVEFDAESDCHKVMVKEEVTLAISRLHQHANCSEFCHEFLVLIKEEMLVVDSSERSECSAVWRTLRRMLRRCLIDEEYAARGRPWQPDKISNHSRQFMEIKRKANTTSRPDWPISETSVTAGKVVQPLKRERGRDKRRKRRSGRVEVESDHPPG